VFDPGLGQVRAGFFYSRYGFTATTIRSPRISARSAKPF